MGLREAGAVGRGGLAPGLGGGGFAGCCAAAPASINMSEFVKFTFYEPIFWTETQINSIVLSSNIIGHNKAWPVNTPLHSSPPPGYHGDQTFVVPEEVLGPC